MASTSPCIACSETLSRVLTRCWKPGEFTALLMLLLSSSSTFKAGGRQGSLRAEREGNAMISGARGLPQNTSGNPRKCGKGKRTTNTGWDMLTTVSLSKRQHSTIKRGSSGGTIISTLLTGDCKNRKAQPRMRFDQKFSFCWVRLSASISQHNGASLTCTKPPNHHK